MYVLAIVKGCEFSVVVKFDLYGPLVPGLWNRTRKSHELALSTFSSKSQSGQPPAHCTEYTAVVECENVSLHGNDARADSTVGTELAGAGLSFYTALFLTPVSRVADRKLSRHHPTRISLTCPIDPTSQKEGPE